MKENVSGYLRNPCSLSRERDTALAAKLLTLPTGFFSAEKSEEWMARSPVWPDDVIASETASRHQPMNWRDSIWVFRLGPQWAFPKRSAQCLVPYSENKGYASNPRRFFHFVHYLFVHCSFVVCVLSCCCHSVALWRFCHYNKFLVLDNKTHSDSDSYKSAFETLLRSLLKSRGDTWDYWCHFHCLEKMHTGTSLFNLIRPIKVLYWHLWFHEGPVKMNFLFEDK